MQENDLKKIAVMVFVLGLVLLVFVFLFQKPLKTTRDDFSDNNLYRFEAIVYSIKETNSGYILDVERTCSQKVFFSADNSFKEGFVSNLSNENISIPVIIEGRSSQGLFVAEKILISR